MRFQKFRSGTIVRLLAIGAVLAPVLSGCGTFGFGLADINPFTKFSSSAYGVGASPRVTYSRYVKKGGGRSLLGKPYKVAGKWYTPTYDPSYDKVGYASWYGPNFHGRLTANGEVFDQYALTAAHPTMPLPSYARVTNLETGRSVIVRVNDRGPYVDNRLIDLSARAADMLGLLQDGTAKVRVQYVGPAPLEGDDTKILMASYNAPSVLEQGRQDIRVASAQPTPATAPMPFPGTGAGNIPVPVTRNADGTVTSLLAYAGPIPKSSVISDAVAAADAMAAGTASLKQWQMANDETARKVDVALGVFTTPANVTRLETAFALIGALENDSLTVDGRSATRLRLTFLKPGVTHQDVLDLAHEFGLNDVSFRR